MPNLVNLTPHPIDIYRLDCDEVLATIGTSGAVARLEETSGARAASLWIGASTRQDGEVEVRRWEPEENYYLAVPCITREYGLPSDLPEPDGKIYIVSMPVLNAINPARADLCSPDFGAGAVRNSRGTVIGTRRLVFRALPPASSSGHDGWRWIGPIEECCPAYGVKAP